MRAPYQLAVTQVTLTFGLAFTIFHRAFLELRRPTLRPVPISSRSFLGKKRARGVPPLFFRTFRQTVLGVVSGLNRASRCGDQVRGVVCGAAVQADIQVQDLFFFCQASARQLIARNIGEESSQVLLWPGRHSTVCGTRRQLVVSSRG